MTVVGIVDRPVFPYAEIFIEVYFLYREFSANILIADLQYAVIQIVPGTIAAGGIPIALRRLVDIVLYLGSRIDPDDILDGGAFLNRVEVLA